jgi:hypothetical protein
MKTASNLPDLSIHDDPHRAQGEPTAYTDSFELQPKDSPLLEQAQEPWHHGNLDSDAAG